MSVRVTAAEALRVLAQDAADALDEVVPTATTNTRVVIAATKAHTVLRMVVGLLDDAEKPDV